MQMQEQILFVLRDSPPAQNSIPCGVRAPRCQQYSTQPDYQAVLVSVGAFMLSLKLLQMTQSK